jgi:hypothetical protein
MSDEKCATGGEAPSAKQNLTREKAIAEAAVIWGAHRPGQMSEGKMSEGKFASGGGQSSGVHSSLTHKEAVAVATAIWSRTDTSAAGAIILILEKLGVIRFAEPKSVKQFQWRGQAGGEVEIRWWSEGYNPGPPWWPTGLTRF